MNDQFHPFYILGSIAFLLAGTIIGYPIGWARAINAAAKVACVECGQGRPFAADGAHHTYKEGADILLPAGLCRSLNIRALKGGRS